MKTMAEVKAEFVIRLKLELMFQRDCTNEDRRCQLISRWNLLTDLAATIFGDQTMREMRDQAERQI